MRLISSKKLVGLVLMMLVFVPLFAQTASDYSDKDKKKMAEIAQRPEVKIRIEKEWQKIRRQDMDYAYTVNKSAKMANWSLKDFVDFRAKYGELYDNPILLRYVNSVGQKLVPNGSPNVYSFKLLLDPVPRAEALTTGTVYVSTGLVALLDNEAQLSYVLAHEMAHIEKNHAYNQIRNEVLEDEFARFQEADSQKKKAIFSALASAATAGIGGAMGGSSGALMGAGIGYAASSIIGHFAFRNRFEPTEWSTVFEDEADEAGLKMMLDRSYDPREIPRLYANLDNMVTKDARVGLGFIGSPTRTRERLSRLQGLLTGTYQNTIQAKLKEAGLTGSTPEFNLLMAALKRDNGVIALDYDLFAMARDNLEEAVKLRSNDPRTHYYLGQVLATTGRSDEDKQQAMTHFLAAIQYDQERGAYPEPHLENALYLITHKGAAAQEDIKKELKTYVALYQREHAGALPGNMHIVYDYLQLAGDNSWYVPPASSISTKYVDSINVISVKDGNALPASDVVQRATGTAAVKTTAQDEPAKPKPAAVRKTQ